jgi:hypothetical protein
LGFTAVDPDCASPEVFLLVEAKCTDLAAIKRRRDKGGINLTAGPSLLSLSRELPNPRQRQKNTGRNQKQADGSA